MEVGIHVLLNLLRMVILSCSLNGYLIYGIGTQFASPKLRAMLMVGYGSLTGLGTIRRMRLLILAAGGLIFLLLRLGVSSLEFVVVGILWL